VIFAWQNLISDALTYFMHARSTGEFRLTLDSAITRSEVWSQPGLYWIFYSYSVRSE